MKIPTQYNWDEMKNSKSKCIEFINWFSSECGNHFDDRLHFDTMIYLAGVLQKGTPTSKIKETAGTLWVIARSW